MSCATRIAEISYGWRLGNGTRTWDSEYVTVTLDDDDGPYELLEKARAGLLVLKGLNPGNYPETFAFTALMAVWKPQALEGQDAAEKEAAAARN